MIQPSGVFISPVPAGRFGLDKLHNVDRTVEYLETALDGLGLR